MTIYKRFAAAILLAAAAPAYADNYQQTADALAPALRSMGLSLAGVNISSGGGSGAVLTIVTAASPAEKAEMAKNQVKKNKNAVKEQLASMNLPNSSRMTYRGESNSVKQPTL